MPGKHVHFNLPAMPPTPSPTFSSTSLPSSGGPFTPSPLSYNHPLPSSPGPTHVAPIIALNQVPAIKWDVSFPPSSAQPATPNITKHALYKAATNPPLPELKIICRSLPVPWSVIVVTPQNNTAYVTVSDVLTCVYQSLRQSLGQHEFYSLFTPDQHGFLSEAFTSRYRRLPNQDGATEKVKGMKRIDCLIARRATRFMGLSSTKEGPHVWLLTVS
ncbi:hypothetical protein VKT23_002997 [Stygiomarasmius scandens]|uniref:DUF6699 domain-containing protein n=1 Tax=Marasmiellus scandens TaxID=2682957 RepID=A0ABR1JYN8_9AGAR